MRTLFFFLFFFFFSPDDLSFPNGRINMSRGKTKDCPFVLQIWKKKVMVNMFLTFISLYLYFISYSLFSPLHFVHQTPNPLGCRNPTRVESIEIHRGQKKALVQNAARRRRLSREIRLVYACRGTHEHFIFLQRRRRIR